jgi:predicted transporter
MPPATDAAVPDARQPAPDTAYVEREAFASVSLLVSMVQVITGSHYGDARLIVGWIAVLFLIVALLCEAYVARCDGDLIPMALKTKGFCLYVAYAASLVANALETNQNARKTRQDKHPHF